MENDQATLTDQAVVTPEPSMADTMRATFDSIKERDTAGDTEATAKAERARAADGKFVAKEPEAAPAAAPAPVVAEPAAPAPAAAVPPVEAAPVDPTAAPLVPAEPAIAAPSSWTGAAKAEFSKASPVIQQEVLRREQQMHNGIAQYRDAANYGQEITKTLAPYNETIQRLGITPAAAIEAMFKVDHTLRYGSPQEKLQHIADLARNYGVDLSGGVPEQQPIDPNYQHLQTQLQQTQQQLKQITADRESQQQAALNSQIEAAKEGRPHFDNLRQEMAVLIQASAANGENLSLPDAYDRAVWSHPTYRAEMLALQQQERAAADAKQRAEATAKATAAAVAAKAASSVNVPKRGTLQAQGQVGSMQDTMRETLDQIRSR